MHYDVCILAPEGALCRLLLAECRDAGRCTAHVRDAAALPPADLFLIDADVFDVLPDTGNVIRYGVRLFDTLQQDGARTVTDLRRPFPITTLRELLSSGGVARPSLTLLPDGETVRLGSTLIPLSPTEYACLATLQAAGGAPVSREALYHAVWGGGVCREELVNLYIHYLRRKLESDGRRRIFSLRGQGYLLKEEGEG